MSSTYETTQPWVLYHYGATHDRWWPIWNSTRVLGFARIGMQCMVCGARETAKVPVPRLGPLPVHASGRHPVRERFLAEHTHPDRPHPMSWAVPLANLAAHPGGLDLDLLAMRLQADWAATREERDDASSRRSSRTRSAVGPSPKGIGVELKGMGQMSTTRAFSYTTRHWVTVEPRDPSAPEPVTDEEIVLAVRAALGAQDLPDALAALGAAVLMGYTIETPKFVIKVQECNRDLRTLA